MAVWFRCENYVFYILLKVSRSVELKLKGRKMQTARKNNDETREREWNNLFFLNLLRKQKEQPQIERNFLETTKYKFSDYSKNQRDEIERERDNESQKSKTRRLIICTRSTFQEF